MNRVVLDRLAPRPGETLLEIGFGGGGLIAMILESGADAIGVDPSPAMIEQAGRRFGDRALLVQGSAERLPLASAAADKACSVNSLYFWNDLQAAMAELARVIRPGGKLVLAFQTPDQVRRWPGHVHGFAAPCADEVAEAMRGAGFGKVRVEAMRDRRLGDFLCLSGERVDAKAAR